MRRWLGVALLMALLPAHAEPQVMTRVAVRPVAPDLTLHDVDGKVRRLARERGKVVLINFWASWCAPCRDELASLQRAWEQLHARNFVVYAVNVGEDEQTIRSFRFDTGSELSFPILLDRDGSAIKGWPVLGLPTTLIIDPTGRIAYSAVGGRDWNDAKLIAQIRELMRTRPAKKPAKPKRTTATHR